LLVLLVILVNAFIALFVIFEILFITLVTFILWLKSALLLVTALCAESCFSLAHFVKLRVRAPITIFVILKDLVLLVLSVFVLELVDHSFGLLLALCILKVVHVEFML
jgi:hypothetical protein